MHRTTLVVDRELLTEVVATGRFSSMSEAVNAALRLYMEREQRRQILSLRGSGAWSGDLSDMRDDQK